jgi:hypothetical protein
MPALMACATERNFGFSSARRRCDASCRVKVEASHSRTSCGTASGCTSLSSSSSSASRLRDRKQPSVDALAKLGQLQPVQRVFGRVLIIDFLGRWLLFPGGVENEYFAGAVVYLGFFVCEIRRADLKCTKRLGCESFD